jgi:hypothetical protein
MVSSPVVSSILSRHTGHVGSSTSDGVGGGNGLRTRLEEALSARSEGRFGVNGSWLMSGKEAEVSFESEKEGFGV